MSKQYDLLYITYDGLLDPLGNSQITPYLKGISKKGIKSIILSFEKADSLRMSSDISKIAHELKDHGIEWRRLKYHKRPVVLASLFDILHGLFVSARLAAKHKIKIVHARSYVVALIALVLKRIYKMKFVFDMRGFWVDERTEADIWKKGGLLSKIARYKSYFKFFWLNIKLIFCQ